jgi:hypothetical protein
MTPTQQQPQAYMQQQVFFPSENLVVCVTLAREGCVTSWTMRWTIHFLVDYLLAREVMNPSDICDIIYGKMLG